MHVKSSDEFISLPSVKGNYAVSTKIYLDLVANASGLKIVYDYNNAEDYSMVEVKANTPITNSYLFRTKGVGKLYLWNPDKIETDVLINSIQEEQLSYHPIMR